MSAMLILLPMWAVVEIGKKQYIVKKQDTLEVQSLKTSSKEVVFDKVLLLADKDKVSIGNPYLNNIKVKASIQGQKRGQKVTVYKYKRRKKYRKKQGHRQNYTILKISDITTSSPRRTTKKES